MDEMKGHAPLAGSDRPRPSSHRWVGAADDKATIAVTLMLRQDPAGPVLPDLAHYAATPLAARRYLLPEEYAERHGASAEDLEAVADFAVSCGLEVRASHRGRRAVEVLGSAARMMAAFGVVLNRYSQPKHRVAHRARNPDGSVAGQDEAETAAAASAGALAEDATPVETHIHHGYDGSVHLPTELQGVVLAVIGLDDRLVGVPTGSGDPAGAAYLSVSAAAAAYNFPNTGAADQTIGVISPQTTPGVGGNYSAADITGKYFPSLPVAFQTAPTLNNVNITIGTSTYVNNPSALTGITAANKGSTTFAAILEVTQDISTSATIAQGATVNVYFTQNSEQGWVAFLNRVLQPQGEKQPTVVTCSFILYLGDDSSYVGNLSDSGSSVSVLTALFQQLASVGVSVFIALGDWGADNWFPVQSGSAPDGSSHVMYPATDPWITSCGGTVVTVNAGPPPSITEFVWSDAYSASQFGVATNNTGATGGGVSKTFAAPVYQTAAGITGATDSAGTFQAGRGVPDIAGMVGLSGFFANGVGYTFFGTSCVAPFYAGLIAVLRSALGVGLAPLNVSLYALAGSAFNDVTTGNNASGDTPANVKLAIPTYTGTTADAPFFTAGVGWDACTGLGSIDGAKLLSGLSGLLYGPNWYFQTKKTTFGFDEAGINAVFAGSVSLVLEGYSPAQVAAAKLVPTVTVVLPGITVTVGPATPSLKLQPNAPQRIFFPCTVTFSKSAVAVISAGGLFPAQGKPDTQAPATSVITFGGQILTAETIFYLESGADPYFSNWDTAGDNAFYLSEDLRVFTVTPGYNNTPFRGLTLAVKDNNNFDTAAAYGYIQAVLNDLNSAFKDGSTGQPDPFATVLPNQSSALSADSLVSPTTPNPAGGTAFANYAFAVARVRLTEKAGASTLKNVRVLFRLFASATSDTDFQPSLTYPSTLDAAGLPQAPLVGFGNVTIPFFATGNYEANGDFGINVDYSGNSVNNQPIVVPASGQGWAYYGCYLNLYPTGNTIAGAAVQTLLPSTHACLVAQIAFDDAPIPTGQALGPENFDKLAQRNIVVTLSDNPGPAAAHRIPQTFDLRPSATIGLGGGLAARPDELMIDWGGTPPGSLAHIYWPAVKAQGVLSLAKSLYPNHALSAGDANTIECVVPKGVTFVPIPPGVGANVAGLFTVDLPAGVKAGQEFTIVVSRISTRSAPVAKRPPPPPPPPRIAGNVGGGATVATTVSTPVTHRTGDDDAQWRYVVGTFAIRIPVTTAAHMRWSEENTYSILTWRFNHLKPADRWRPVLERYLRYIAGRIEGVGGNPHEIHPSPWGIYGPGQETRGGDHRHHEHSHDRDRHRWAEGAAHTGKVAALLFDRFGDFEGFLLMTEHGHERRFESRESEIEALARYSWEERAVITVRTDQHDPCRPAGIILRRAPPQPRRWKA